MWTLPSLPLVGPSARPMYWAKIRQGSTPRDDVDAHVAVERRADVLRAHRGGDADRGGLVPAAGVERAGDLALLVEDVAALLDPARDQHVAVDAEQVLAVEACLADFLQRADRLGSSRDRHRGANSSDRSGYSRRVSRARNWLQEERRKTLGDWVAFCLRCGFVQRYFEDYEAELPAACPQCGGELRVAVPELRRALRLRVRRRVRGLRRRAAAARAVRRQDPRS